jgi:3-dehydroquinate synthase
MTHKNTIIPVSLGHRSYDIEIGSGLLAQAGQIVARFLKRPFVAIVTDTNVAQHHLKSLEVALGTAGIKTASVIVPAGESSKSFEELAKTCDALLGLGVERNDVVVALGGGVIGDLTGFAASILRRGVRFVQIPTSLLAHVDSSVGGKTGINSRHGKNLIGSFHQPSHVIIDLDVVRTLPRRQIAAGYAEIAKYGLLGDASFFAWLETHAPDVLACDAAALAHAVATSCAMKARIVANDETETGERALLNLGHTFGHAYEAANGYTSALLHGEAISVGMVQAFKFSGRLGLCDKDVYLRVKAHFEKAGLPVDARRLPIDLPSPEKFLEIMRQDKKSVAGNLTFILARGIGNAFVASGIPDQETLAFLKEDFAAA